MLWDDKESSLKTMYNFICRLAKVVDYVFISISLKKKDPCIVWIFINIYVKIIFSSSQGLVKIFCCPFAFWLKKIAALSFDDYVNVWIVHV